MVDVSGKMRFVVLMITKAVLEDVSVKKKRAVVWKVRYLVTINV